MVHLVHDQVQRVFVGRAFGRGMASYERRTGYTPYAKPTKVGARYFFPEPDYDESTDQPIPAAQGNKWDGGKPEYQRRVYAAAQKVGKDQGLSPADIARLKPRQVA